MIVCLGPNPAIDRTALVETLAVDVVLRPLEVVVLPGGKALCAARAAFALGAPVAVGLIVGGHGGRWLAAASEREGLNPTVVDSEIETRTTYVIVDRRGRTVAVYEPSSPVPQQTFNAYLGIVSERLLPRASWVVLAGSLPTGIAPDAFGDLVERCRSAGRPCLVDTSGPALSAAVVARPEVVKVSRSEAESGGFGSNRQGLVGAAEAARAIVAAGAHFAIVTDGARGSAASDGERVWIAEPPRVRSVCAIGSGDAFGAGFVVARSRGASPSAALASATAAGAANACVLGAGRLKLADYQVLLEQVRVVERRLRASRERPTRQRCT